MLIDYHLHSQFSCDSRTNMEQICQAALNAGLTEIAFTDHMDLTYPHQYENHYIHDLDHYFATIAQYQQRYSGQLRIRVGLEIGLERHRLKQYEKIINGYPFDFIIGSVHEINGVAVSQKAFFQGKSKLQVYQQYYSAILDCIQQFDHFDVIGHLDYCKRYNPAPYQAGDHLLCLDLVTQLLQELIGRGKGLEVNTSGFRHSSAMCLPHFDILRHYRQLGGTIITTGSDSHRAEYVGYPMAETTAVLKQLGFQTISTFGLRHEHPVAL